MTGLQSFLPETGRWREAPEGALLLANCVRIAPSTTGCAGGPPPRAGEEL